MTSRFVDRMSLDGSAGTLTGSAIGSGGAGGLAPPPAAVLASAIGEVGFATGGFLPPHATVKTDAATIQTAVRAAAFRIISFAPVGPALRRTTTQACSVDQFDQLGWKLFPLRVNCLRSLPSRAIVKICTFPARVDENARWRPFGANAGLSLVPSPKVSRLEVFVARSSTSTSNPGPLCT